MEVFCLRCKRLESTLASVYFYGYFGHIQPLVLLPSGKASTSTLDTGSINLSPSILKVCDLSQEILAVAEFRYQNAVLF